VTIRSLSFRLLFAAGIVLAAFFALVAAVLERSFQESAEQALKEKLQIHVYSLLSTADFSRTGHLKMPQNQQEPRFSNPGSGLHAFVQTPKHRPVWRSNSAIGVPLIPSPALKPGTSAFSLDPSGHFVLHYDVIWESESGHEREYIFTVAEDADFMLDQVESFRKTLRGWLVIIGAALVLVQFLVLRWGLKPLRVIGQDLEAIEQGKKNRLEGRYPAELQGLANNLNAFIDSERAHLERYRNTLADLAHSLKTPLAIMRGALQAPELAAPAKGTLGGQISRMTEIVDYQLQRAAAKGQKKLTGKVNVAEIIDKIAASLQKVYAQRPITIKINSNRNCIVYCEEGDLYEIAGNLMDNACKWCKQTIRVSLRTLKPDKHGNYSLCLQIEDDGPGIPPHRLQEILKRGVRADENIQGHGIGMAVVNELTALLGGKLEGGQSSLGGMKWVVYLP
jgi:two-component system sensor histidine kinase PhoQ